MSSAPISDPTPMSAAASSTERAIRHVVREGKNIYQLQRSQRSRYSYQIAFSQTQGRSHRRFPPNELAGSHHSRNVPDLLHWIQGAAGKMTNSNYWYNNMCKTFCGDKYYHLSFFNKILVFFLAPGLTIETFFKVALYPGAPFVMKYDRYVRQESSSRCGDAK